MKKFLVIMILLICNIVSSQPGWYSQNSETNRNLKSLYFVNSNTGWVVGDSIVLKTTNGGQNWISQTLPVQATINSVHFLNENTGFLAGDNNYYSYVIGTYVFKTTNGGSNWNIIYSKTPAIFGNAYIKDVYAVNENIVYRNYSEYLSFTSSGSILKSTNGGVNYSNSLECGTTEGLSFINSQTGWITCTYQEEMLPIILRIYKTTNEGNNWSLMFNDSINAIRGREIQFLNSSTGYALGYIENTMLVKTTNGGINWTTNIINNYNNRAMYFVNANTGWIAGYTSSGNSNISKTTNGGQDWVKQNLAGTEIINGIFFTDTLTGWAVGYYGVILKTLTGGLTSAMHVSTDIPSSYLLSQNYPNPFNPKTVISFQLPAVSDVMLKVYDLMGREVETLVNERLQPGTYSTQWNASGYSSGIYFYTLQTEKFKQTKRMVLLK
ncbi:MAG: YCF48-related protein [Ignavibacteria bacterium]